MKKLGTILLGAWLILSGLIGLTDFDFNGSATILAIVAVAAGALMLIGDRGQKISTHLADFALGIWLVLAGLAPLIGIHFRGSHAVIEALAVLAGVLVVMRR